MDEEEITVTGRSSAQKLIDNSAALLCYHPQTKIVHHEFRRFVHGAEFREVLERGLELIQKHRATKWLSDDRGNGPLKPADAEWSSTDWAPRATAAGWKYWAVVMPLKVLGQMNMNRWITHSTSQGVTAKAFAEPGKAKYWLMTQVDEEDETSRVVLTRSVTNASAGRR